jgi:hypothetical protein
LVNNFTVQDVLGILLVLPFFSLVLVAPGYLIGLASNVLDFRRVGISERLLLAVAISAAVSPYAINILCRFVSVGIVSALFILAGVAFIARLLLEWRRSDCTFRIEMHRTTKIAIGLASIWIVIGIIVLPDMQLGQRIYSTVSTFDYSVRSPLIASALRTGSPPANPFFYPGHYVPARYFYYWNVLCAIPAFLSRSSARVTLYASCIWSGLLLASMIPIYLKHFLEQTSRLRAATVVAMAMLAVTGLDLIPTVLICTFKHMHPHPDMEWWDPGQIASWLDEFIWVPHHVAALVACLAAYLFLWRATRKGDASTRTWLIALAAFGFSSAAGLSVFVTFAFGAFIFTWVVYLLLRGRISAAVLHGAAGAVALLLSIGYIRDLLGSGKIGSDSSGASGHFVAFALREVPFVFDFHNNFENFCVWVLLISIVLSLELGVYLLIGLARASRDWRRWRTLSEAQKAFWVMAGSSVLLSLFVRSTVLKSNDLGWRSAMVLQFVLLLWAADYLTNRYSTHREAPPRGWSDQQMLGAMLYTLMAIGVASTVYQLGILRVYPLLSDRHNWTDFIDVASGADAFAVRTAYADLDRVAPANAIVQFNPDGKLINQMLVYSRYQVAAGDTNCNTTFGGSADECAPLQAGLQAIFEPDARYNSTKVEVDKICHALHIDVLLVNAHDPVWIRKDSWVWQDTPIIHNQAVRVYRCGSAP